MTDLSTYLVIFKQAGEGCDYTIGCGTKVVQITATSTTDAFMAALGDMGWEPDYDYWDDELAMESVIVVKVAEMDIDIFNDHRSRLRAIQEQRKQDAIDRAEYEQYKRLKEKFADR